MAIELLFQKYCSYRLCEHSSDRGLDRHFRSKGEQFCHIIECCMLNIAQKCNLKA